MRTTVIKWPTRSSSKAHESSKSCKPSEPPSSSHVADQGAHTVDVAVRAHLPLPGSPKRNVNLIEFYGLEEDDVVAYLLSVKVAFADEVKFIMLVKLLKDYKAQKISADDLVKEAKILFEHHPDLLLAFNAVLPETKKVAVEFFLQPVEQECLDFIIKLKDLSPNLQKSFLNIMKNYGHGKMSSADLIGNVTTLLHRHKNLQQEFSKFIPGEYNFEKGTLPSHQNKEEDKAPRKKKLTKCNFPELVFNKQILFFEKAKVKLQRKKDFERLLYWLETYLEGRITSCELQSEVRTLCPDLDEGVDELFVHDHPSYFMLSEKQKLQHTKSLSKLLNDNCRLFKYEGVSEASSQVEQQSIQEHSQAQEQNKKRKKDLDIDSLQDEYDVEMHRNRRTLEAICHLMEEIQNGSNANFDKLLTGFNFTSIKNCCKKRNIRWLKKKKLVVLLVIMEKIKRRQGTLESRLRLMESIKATVKAKGNGVKKQR